MPATPRQAQHRLSLADAVAMAQAYQSGMDMKVLAEKYGVHRTTVTAWMRKLGIKLRHQPLVDDDLPRVVKLYQQGWSLARVADEFGCDAETVRRVLKQAGVPRRPPGWPSK